MPALIITCLLALFSPMLLASPVDNLSEAIRFKTISHQDRSLIDTDAFAGFNQFLRQRFPLSFSRLQVETINDYSLLLRWPGGEPDLEPVLFTAHLDVVPIEPGTEGGWDEPPFSGAVVRGRIYGRGAMDDKVGVLSLLEASERLLAAGFEPRRGLVMAFGHDEEIGGEQGAGAIADRMRELGLRFAFLVDEGGFILDDNPLLPGRPVATVNVGEKGYLTLILSVTGEGGHSSMPPVQSTIGRLANAVSKIEASPFPTRLVGPVQAMLETMAGELDFPMSFLLGNLWLTKPLVLSQMERDRTMNAFVRTTTALTMFNAGVKENVVPQRAEARVNFRLLPGDEPKDVVAHVKAAIDDPGIDVTYERWQNRPPVANYQGGGFHVIRDAIHNVYPDTVVAPSLLMATTDTRHYFELAGDAYRFHGVKVSMAQASGAHGTNEFVDVASYLKTIDVAEQMMRLSALH